MRRLVTSYSPRRASIRTIERDLTDWFSFPWKMPRPAAALAVDLCRSITPPIPRVPVMPTLCADDDCLPFWHSHSSKTLLAQAPIDPNQAVRDVIDRVLELVSAYAEDRLTHGHIPDKLENYDGDDELSRIYWTAYEWGREARTAVYDVVGAPHETVSWYALGECVQEATKIVQKWAANSTGGGCGLNPALAYIVDCAIDRLLLDPRGVAEKVLQWRFRDALGSRPPTDDLRRDFVARWTARHYEAAYRGCDR